MKLTLHVYKGLEELSALRPAWDDLLTQYPPATTFSTWEWLTCWWQSFGRNKQLLVLALSDSSSLLGLAPLAISEERVGWFPSRVLRLMGDGSGDSDNLDLPVRPGFEKVFAEYILDYLMRHKRSWDVCLFETLPEDSLVSSQMQAILGSSRWKLFQYSSNSSAVLLPQTWEMYTQSLTSEDRNNLVRYTRRLQKRYRTRIHRCTCPDELHIFLEALFRLHQGRWQSGGQPGSFSSSERRDFYARLSSCLLARKWLELWALELDGEIAAVQFAFRYGDRVFQLQEGYDHKRNTDRPGFVLRGEVLKQLISEKVRMYDFLGGEDPYKVRWGARAGCYSQLHFAPTFSVGALCLELLDKASKSKQWLRKKTPSSLWRTLHRVNLRLRNSSDLYPKPVSVNEGKRLNQATNNKRSAPPPKSLDPGLRLKV